MKPQELYLDYFNNFLTIKGFADYYAMTETEAQEVIDKGRAIHEAQFADKGLKLAAAIKAEAEKQGANKKWMDDHLEIVIL